MTSTSPRRSRRVTTKPASIALESTIKRKLKAVPVISADSDSGISNSGSSQQQRLLLQEWMDHDEASFHHFSPETAEAIRSALLNWYTGNRRKLPWRGDPPPYDGSTAGINNGKKKAKQALDAQQKNQANITNFFATASSTTSTKAKKKQKDETPKVIEPLQAAIPMTGYGVWVSEIMLQQTRVETVIPYWLKCKFKYSTVQYSTAQ